jgi:nicotinamide-nucleotide amidase
MKPSGRFGRFAMQAEILSTGEEIRTGSLVDTNAAFIARRLEEAGVRVARIQAVGDDLQELTAVLAEIGGRSDAAVVTGGLGPTEDDRSAEAASIASGTKLRLDPEALARLEAVLRERGFPMTPARRKQAVVPEGADVLPNRLGTAPGFALAIGRCRFFFLPGVPHEMHAMLEAHVLPRLSEALGGRPIHRATRTLACFGLAEADTGDRLGGLGELFSSVSLGLRAAFPEIQVKLYAAAADREAAAGQLEAASAWARKRLGDALFSETGESLPAAVGRMLRERGATLALAESCTGGLLAHLLTETPGSSDYFLASVVSYANAAKTRILGVEAQSLESHGAVHTETAREMAIQIRNLAGSTYALATSGIAGPAGGTQEKPVGTVCIGLAGPAGARGYRFVFGGLDRSRNKALFAHQALDLLRRELLGAGHQPPGT